MESNFTTAQSATWNAARRAVLAFLAGLPLTVSGCSAGAQADGWQERRSEIEHMTPQERDHLQRKEERFAKFSLDEQRRMRRLYDELEHDPNAEPLRQVLVAYHEWVDTLPPRERAELSELPPDARIERIRSLKAQQQSERAQELKTAPSAADRLAILVWLEQLAWQKRDSLTAGLSPARRDYLNELERGKQRRAYSWLLIHRWHGGNKPQRARPSDAEIDELGGRLSPASQQQLDKVGSLERNRLVNEWLQLAINQRLLNTGVRRMLPGIDAAELQRFLRDELTVAQRESLLQLSREQMHRVLLRLYFQPADRLAELHAGSPGWPQPGKAPDRKK